MKRSRVRRRPRRRTRIDLAAPSVSLVIEAKLFKAPTPFTFQIVSDDLILNLCAHDEGDFFQWIEAIAAVLHTRDEKVRTPGSRPRRTLPAGERKRVGIVTLLPTPFRSGPRSRVPAQRRA